MHNFKNTLAVAGVSFLLLLLTSCTMAQQSVPDQIVLRPVISENSIPVQSIAPVATDNFVGEAFLRKPSGAGPFPAVVLIHGGAPRWPTSTLRDFIVHVHASRFLAAGYVVVAITRRELNLSQPVTQVQESVVDTVAVIDYLQTLPYIDSKSIVVRGTSVGGYLALEAGAARDVAAVMVEEPFSMPFVGVSLGSDNNALNTDKIEKINSPILLVRGDQTPNINNFNRDLFIPAVRAANKSLKVLTYPGELHSFAFYNSPERTLRPAVALTAFNEIKAFFRENVSTQPIPLEQDMVQHEVINQE